MSTIRPIAMFLPQFHPIPENDAWWGKGFTEWTNVTKAQPAFEGHHQPHLPADLGFYDLRLQEVREAQAALAKQYGIEGFCYYHYWFNGRRILERPFQEIFESGKPDFPFMLCWANENWTRIWDGSDKDILLEQNYSAADDLNHIQSLMPYFKDPRYIKIEGKPVFAVYRSSIIPDVKSTIAIWREEAAKHGIELYLCRMESFWEGGADHLEAGFDAAIRFEPFSTRIKSFSSYWLRTTMKNKLSWWYIKYKFSSEKGRKKMFSLRRLDYKAYVDFIKTHNEEHDYKLYPGVTPMWDNYARKKDEAFMFTGSTPEKFQEWVEHEIDNFTPFSKEENLFFINAWNEWAEGNHLEPCQKWGHRYLKAVQDALRNK
jgi:lipopolysaccharide biosynthesis protein